MNQESFKDKEEKEYPENKKEHPERPLECSECTNPITFHYKEIVEGKCTNTGMCNVCPHLQRRLRGIAPEEQEGILGLGQAKLVCGECGTTLSNVRVGHQLGCSHCYEVFGDVLLEEMIAVNKISPVVIKKKKTVPVHVGRAPGEIHEMSSSLQLIALNEALEETLKKEDYEQAALLRDQIKALTEEKGGMNGQKN